MIQSIKEQEKYMIQWLNTHVGTDSATYQGWVLGIVSIGLTIYGLYRATSAIKNKISITRIKQNAEHIQGTLNQAGRDVNNTTNHHYDGADENALLQKEKKDHDLKIIKEILILLPYERTIDQVDRSHLDGMLNQFALDLEDAEKYTDERYCLFNAAVNGSKNAFINSIKSFNNSYLGFLSVDHIYSEPCRLDLPHNWKHKGGKSEENFRKHQRNMRETSGLMKECYRDFVKTFKEQGFITENL